MFARKTLLDSVEAHSLNEIKRLLDQAKYLFNSTLSEDTKAQLSASRINAQRHFHNENTSLGHCLHWADVACGEIVEVQR